MLRRPAGAMNARVEIRFVPQGLNAGRANLIAADTIEGALGKQ